MGQSESRTTFGSLITKNHVEHALIQQDGEHNIIPMALASVAFLNGTSEQVQAMYDDKEAPLRSWPISPGRIPNLEERQWHLGDARFQRAYMDYFSMENGKMKGNTKALAVSQLLAGPIESALISGLFGGYGQPLIMLADGIELSNPIMIIEALVLAAVDWSKDMAAILTHPQLPLRFESPLQPDAILSRIAYDGRLSGLMRSGPGLDQISLVLSNQPAKTAVIDYIHQLDIRDIPGLVDQLSYLAVQLLCATHKKEKPAFDWYLSFLPSAVQALRVLLSNSDDEHYRTVLVRGTWLLMVLSYITQLRPCIDDKLISQFEVAEEDCNWDSVFDEFLSDVGTVRGRYLNAHLLRALRSLSELGKGAGEKERLYILAAWKLRCQWNGWTGLGNPREESLHIRL